MAPSIPRVFAEQDMIIVGDVDECTEKIERYRRVGCDAISVLHAVRPPATRDDHDVDRASGDQGHPEAGEGGTLVCGGFSDRGQPAIGGRWRLVAPRGPAINPGVVAPDRGVGHGEPTSCSPRHPVRAKWEIRSRARRDAGRSGTTVGQAWGTAGSK